MAALKPTSVDLVFADPPFNIGYDYDTYDDKQDRAAYLQWSRDWMAAVRRVLKPGGAFWLAIGDEYAAELKLIAQNAYPGLSLGDAGFTCRSWVIWYYTFGVHCKLKFTRSHAHLFHFVMNPDDFTFNVDAIRVPSARQLVYNDKRAHAKGRMPDDTWLIPPHVPDTFVLRPQDIPESFEADGDTWFFSRVAGTFR
ncbi:MAG: DNA-methyltransferase, partial [Phycisphaerae bacterium]